ncbi:MAG: DUF6306 domain-containing protein [Gammaproteobacteria bacterium]|nr:DUF6306 domain-containing protein [Gammaproteobacteria bacterium]
MGARIWLKRARDRADSRDGCRVLVDALWPRGVRRADAALDLWLKEIGPDPELRTWFGHRPDRFARFRARYLVQLRGGERRVALDELRARVAAGRVTLVFGARDRKNNHAVVLRDLLEGRFRFADPAPASAPCSADSAAAGDAGLADRDGIAAALEELLEAERAGVRVARRMAREPGPAELLERIHEDELASCRLLMDALRYLGVTPGSAIGAFEARVMALEGLTERMALLERGQAWVERRLSSLLPRLGDPVLEASACARRGHGWGG